MNHAKISWTVAVTVVMAALCLLLRSCTNNPWPASISEDDTYFTSFSSEFKTFDPAVSYYVHEGELLDSIVEMPFCYDYLKRPYELAPMLATEVPQPIYYSKDGTVLPGDPPAADVARVEYVIHLKEGVKYQPHPCFAKEADGTPSYKGVKSSEIAGIKSIASFPKQDTRIMTAEDFKVALTRLCDTRLSSPIYSTFLSFITGMDECSETIKAEVARLEEEQQKRGLNPERYSVLPDYRKIPLKGVEVVDDKTFKVIMPRKYPQALYWMSLHFFSPVPYEALEFFAEPAIVDAGFAFKNWPIGTGPYMMTDCNLRDFLTLKANPNFRDDFYHWDGSAEDKAAGLMADEGQKMPFIKQIRFQFERESIPVWIKFLQGYYDTSGIPSDMYDAAVNMETNGDMGLSPEMAEKGMQMISSVSATSFYLGFNMLDPVIGGMDPKQKKLRQAISIVLDYQEYIDIFMNGRGVMSQSILAPGIYGCQEGKEGVNPFTCRWDEESQKIVRLDVERAKQLMVEAGYPNGVGPDGKPLVLHYDASGSGSQSKAGFLWMREKLSKLGIVLEERLTDLNRFRDKVNKGDWQMLMTGWVADYPDPENFLFLFASENSVVASQGGGSNKTNYSSPEFDKVFHQLETMNNGPERMELIKKALRIIQEDAPCCWGYHPKSLVLTHGWLKNYKPHHMAKTFKKCLRIDTEARNAFRRKYNQPILWPGYIGILVVYACGLLLIWRKKD